MVRLPPLPPRPEEGAIENTESDNIKDSAAERITSNAGGHVLEDCAVSTSEDEEEEKENSPQEKGKSIRRRRYLGKRSPIPKLVQMSGNLSENSNESLSGADEVDFAGGLSSGYVPSFDPRFEFVRSFLSAADGVCRMMFKRPLKYFCQLEDAAETGLHLHVLFPGSMCGRQVVSRFMKNVSKSVASKLNSGTVNWNLGEYGFTWTMSHWKDKRVKMVNVHYLFVYLLKKVAPECIGRWTNYQVFEPDYAGQVEDSNVLELVSVYDELMRQRRLVEKCMMGENSSDDECLGDERVGPSTKKKRESSSVIKQTKRQKMCVDVMEDLVQWFVKNRVTSVPKWMKTDMKHYIKYQSYSTYRPMIKPAMEMATSLLLHTGKLTDFLVGLGGTGRLSYNRIEDVFVRNGYDPGLVAGLFYRWASGMMGKRNTILMYGPPTTGKTVIASAICHAVDPFYGNVNWNNENFPFNDCVDKLLIWWEEGRITAKNVEAAKCILGGVSCRVDRKGKESVEISSTPVLITSNLDMTAVYEGNVVNYNHKGALEDRMTCLLLKCRLETSFGRVTEEEVFDWFDYGKAVVESGRSFPDVFNFPML